MYWLLIFSFLLGVHLYLRRRPSGYPPGYGGMPILGALPFLSNKPAITFLKWSKKMGPIYYVQLGMKDFIILNDFESVKECMIKQGKYTSGRAGLSFFTHENKAGGIIFQTDNYQQNTLRKTIVSSLKGMGVGKKNIEENIQEEVGYLIEEILLHEGKAFNTQPMFSFAVASNIAKIAFGERLDPSDKRMNEILSLHEDIWNHPFDSILASFLTFFYGLRHLPVFSGAFSRLRKNIEMQSAIFAKFIEDHEHSFDPENIRDAVDQMIYQKSLKQNNLSYTKNQMVQTVSDLFFGGTDTSANTLQWCIWFLAKYPDVQDTLYNEIFSGIGSAMPRWNHRTKLPVTCSFLDEILRYMSITPHLGHCTQKDFNLFQYVIPKGTMIFVCIWAVHRDPRYFKDPEKFIPDRFVDKETGKYIKSKFLVPFGLGPRMCLGYQLAEKEIFIFLCSIIQKFKIEASPDFPLPNFEDGVFGLLHFPKRFQVCFVER